MGPGRHGIREEGIYSGIGEAQGLGSKWHVSKKNGTRLEIPANISEDNGKRAGGSNSTLSR
jgi:hypothetical protein